MKLILIDSFAIGEHNANIGPGIRAEGTAVVTDYDFRIAKAHLRGNGWRGLAALAIVLIVRAAIVGVIALSARSGGVWLAHLVEHLR
jgi:hypothetical protein